MTRPEFAIAGSPQQWMNGASDTAAPYTYCDMRISMDTILSAAIAPILTSILPVFGLAGIAIYAYFRLNSTQIVREKIWSTFVDDKGFNDQQLKSFADEQLDLARFRVVYGVPAQSITDVHRLLAWMERHAITATTVKRLRGWINASGDELLRIPKKRDIAAILAVIVILAGGCIFTATAMSNATTALLTMRASKTWVLSDGNDIRSPWTTGWRIDAQSCAKHTIPGTAVTALTPDETTDLCQAITDGNLKITVQGALKIQYAALAILSFFFLIFSAWVALKGNVALAARRLGKQVHSHETCVSESLSPSEEPQAA